MRTLFLTVLLMISCSCMAQQPVDTTSYRYPGEMFTNLHIAAYKMDQFRTRVLIGSALEIMGGTVLMYNYSKDNEPSNGLLIAGAGITTAGILIHLLAYDKLKEASDALKRIKPASDGIGVAVRL